jgi:hypothetical protein
VNSYLDILKLSAEAKQFVNSAGPDQLRWLHESDADRAGIQYVTILPPVIAKPSRPTTVADEERAKNFVNSYFAVWSSAGTNVEGLEEFYGPEVNFYGGLTLRSKIMEAKRAFAVRWPDREYAVRADSLRVQCQNTVCSVDGEVTWNVASQQRGARSSGRASFALRMTLDGTNQGGRIFFESGSTISRQQDMQPSGSNNLPMSSMSNLPAGMPAGQYSSSQTSAYAEGRLARIQYEGWYNSLSEGDYKEGASFWAANRSIQPVPSCVRLGMPQWEAGCSAARARLAASDIRRRSEKDFWWGWNSL